MTKLYPFLAYVLVTTFTPGPNNILAMTHAHHSGLRRTMPFLLGIFTGFLAIMLVCCVFDVTFVALLPRAKFWLNLLGAVYMIVLAIQIMATSLRADDSGGTAANSFRAGLVVQFLNPKVILYGITVYSVFIVGEYSGQFAAIVFAPLLATVGFISSFVWAAGGGAFRRQLRQYWRYFNVVMGLLLLYTAVAALMGN